MGPKKLSVALAALVPALTSTKVICQPSPPEATKGKKPPAVPTLASGGTVVRVVTVPWAVSCGVSRTPSTLIWPPAGVSNSTVPRLPIVTGNPFMESGKEKEI